jgi:hypothetical protein
MAVLQMVSEEEIGEDHLEEYLEDLYKIVCVSERPASLDSPAGLVRTTYLVDWEQLVHLLEDYGGFGEDIVEVAPVSLRQMRTWRPAHTDEGSVARA